MQPTPAPSRGVASRVAAAAVLGVALVVLAVWLTWRLPGARGVSAIAALAVSALAAAAAALAAPRVAGRARRAWLLLAVGAAIWSLGQAYRIAVELGRRDSTPSRVSAGLFIAATLVALVGLLQLPARRLDRGNLLRLGLDVLMVGTALGVAAWALVIAPGLARDGGAELAREYGVPYATAAVLTLTVAVLVAARAGGRWLLPVLLVCGGLALCAVGRLTMVGRLVRGDYAI
ncbi:MAG TPA: hypothetical protein VLM05_11995, partial [Mycobacteriales bacterium]|nr:hypothetical protein [Mycobacteriales bacterium]